MDDDNLGGRVTVIHDEPTKEDLEKLVDYWRNMAVEQQALAYKRRPFIHKVRDVVGYIAYMSHCFYLVRFKGHTGPFS